MSHCGMRNTCNSQFFVTLAPTPHLDGKHVVFGHVIEGEEVLDEVEKVGTEGGKPSRKVWIYDCGEEDRVLLRREALMPTDGLTNWTTPQTTSLQAEPSEVGEGVVVPRPEPHSHIDEISPVPDEVWRRAKARRDNML